MQTNSPLMDRKKAVENHTRTLIKTAHFTLQIKSSKDYKRKISLQHLTPRTTLIYQHPFQVIWVSGHHKVKVNSLQLAYHYGNSHAQHR